MEKMAQNVVPADEIGNVNQDDISNEMVLILKSKCILEDKKNSNYIIDLLQGLLSENENELTIAMDCLGRVFTELLQKEEFLSHLKEPVTEPEKNYHHWLFEQLEETKMQLINFLSHHNKNVQIKATSTLLLLLCKEFDSLQETCSPQELLLKMVCNLLSDETDTSRASALTSSLPSVHIFSFLKTVSFVLKGKPKQEVSLKFLLNAYAILKLSWIPKSSKSCTLEDDSTAKQLHNLKLVYSQAWVEFLKFQIPFQIYKKVLIDIHEKVLPSMKNPLHLTDFLTDSYNYGGAVSLLALNGLFYLIQKYNLEYPDFFSKLYALLTEDVFQAKFRPRFFYLLDLFLSSTHLPAYLVAAFCKRLSRLCLVAPPDVLLIILPFIRNLMVRHSSLHILIDRKEGSEVSADPYVSEELDPNKCRAIESSLWEIKALQNHWHPLVSKEATFVNKHLPSMEKDLGEIFETTYTELFDKEVGEDLEEIPLSYEIPKGLFSRSEDNMTSLWVI